jgi:hypothetical protein
MKSFQVVVLFFSATGSMPWLRKMSPTAWPDTWHPQVGHNPIVTEPEFFGQTTSPDSRSG